MTVSTTARAGRHRHVVHGTVLAVALATLLGAGWLLHQPLATGGVSPRVDGPRASHVAVTSTSIRVEILEPEGAIVENQVLSLRVRVLFVNQSGIAVPHARENITVHLLIHDGRVDVPLTYTRETGDDGSFWIENLVVNKITGNASLSMRVVIEGGLEGTVSVPIVQDFWERHGVTIAFIAGLSVLLSFLLVTRGIPRAKQAVHERRIATLKQVPVAGAAGTAGTTRSLHGAHVPPVELLPRDSFYPYVRAGPSELVDLDVSSASRAKGSSSPGAATGATAPESLASRMTRALGMAAEMESQGLVDVAISFLEEALACASMIGLENDAVLLTRRIGALRQKEGKE